jgi:chromosome partitioning protein
VLVNNAVVAAPEVILPLVPEQGIMNGLTRTRERIIDPLRDRIGLEVLAVAPNRLRQRIDHQTSDRKLIESVCRSDHLSKRVPNFAWVDPETFDAIEAGESVDIPKPGIRFDQNINDAFEDDQTLGAYNPENEQLAHFDELAEIVATGGVDR